jgi:hypothetical protein
MYAKQRYVPFLKKTRDVEKIAPVNLRLPYIYIYFFYYYYFFFPLESKVKIDRIDRSINNQLVRFLKTTEKRHILYTKMSIIDRNRSKSKENTKSENKKKGPQTKPLKKS